MRLISVLVGVFVGKRRDLHRLSNQPSSGCYQQYNKEICESSNIFGVIKAFKCSLVELVECSVCWGEDSESSVGSIRAEGVHEVCNP